MIRFIYVNLGGRRRLVCLAAALTFVAVACDVLVAFPLKFVIDKIVHGTDPSVPALGWLLDYFDRFGDAATGAEASSHTELGVILFSATLALSCGVLSAAVSYAQLTIAASVSQGLGAKLRNRVFEHVEHLPLDWHVRQRTGDVVQRITGNVTDIEKLVTDGLVDFLSGILMLAGVLLVMALLNWQFTLLSMVIVPPLFFVIVYYTRRIKRASRQTSRAAGEVAEVATESVGAISEVKAFTLEGWAARTMASRVERQRSSAALAGRKQAEFNPLVVLLVSLSTVTIISVGAWLATADADSMSVGFMTIPTDGLTIGSLTVFLAYSKQLYGPMRHLSKLTLLASNAASAVERIEEVLSVPWEEGPAPAGREVTTRIQGTISYRGVVFGYEEDRPVLHGIDLDIPPGKRLALVGLSGSGKTTLVRLLPRFYEPWKGSITIDGVDVGTYPRELLRRNVGMVLQDSVLFEGTIRENIVLDCEGVTDAQVVAAATQAYVHDTIVEQLGGYDAPVRERGKNFSSGQRQRIAIARAFLRDAPILILDEPTANLDVEAEAEVMRAIERLTAGRTVIVISHRLSTLGHVDEIAVLESGRIVERGTYQELKRRGGAFARLLAEQNRYAAEPIDLGAPEGAGGGASVDEAVAKLQLALAAARAAIAAGNGSNGSNGSHDRARSEASG